MKHVRARERIEESETPDGEPLTLTFEDGAHVARVRGEVLMSSHVHGSEQAMAELAFAAQPPPAHARVLVGGLGMGFTVRAVLDALGADATIEVVELLEAVVCWNRDHLGKYADHPLDDPRVRLTITDLLDYVSQAPEPFDAVLIDVDNGPEAFTVAGNSVLYSPAGLAALHDALVPGGVMVLWSAFRSPRFEQRLGRAGFDARSVTVRARAQARKGARHTLFVASRPPR